MENFDTFKISNECTVLPLNNLQNKNYGSYPVIFKSKFEKLFSYQISKLN